MSLSLLAIFMSSAAFIVAQSIGFVMKTMHCLSPLLTFLNCKYLNVLCNYICSCSMSKIQPKGAEVCGQSVRSHGTLHSNIQNVLFTGLLFLRETEL